MSPAEADRRVDSPAAYVHIPFCSAVCPYCDFAVVAGAEDLAERYITAVIDEVEASEPWRPLDSVYFGGGTPSHLDPSLLSRVLEALERRHGLAERAEVSLEANPEDFDRSRAEQLRAAGFNRVSFGAQSFDDQVLRWLGRRHVGSDVDRSMASARAAGFENVSLDLIFGSPIESDDSWGESLRRAVTANPDHVSCYALTVEPGTPLHRQVKAGADGPDDDVQADRYEAAEMLLGSAGYQRYEVSNWSRPGMECGYNLTVWAQGQYEAYGNGAHRFRDGVRSHNVRRLQAYIDRIEAGASPVAGSEVVAGWEAELDRLFVGLRRSTGVVPGLGGAALLSSRGGGLLLQERVVEVSEGRIVVRRPLLTDAVHRQVLDLEPPQGWVEHPEPDTI